MNDIKKINEYFLKLMMNNKNVVYEEDDLFIYITDSYAVYRIAKDDLKLDLSKMKKLENNFIKNLFNPDEELKEVKDLNIIKEKKWHIFKLDEEEKNINDLYLKLLKNKDLKYFSKSGAKEMIKVKNINDIIIAVILPAVTY